jgi:RNA polymerase sigma-70 factor (ECF subfamily)
MGFDHLFEDRDSFASQLIRQKARQLVRHPGFTKSEREDIEQELRIELVQKYRCFDPDRARETTFIARVLENKVISLIRARAAEKRDFRRDARSLNETVSDAEGGQVEQAQTLDAPAARAHTGQSPRSAEEQAQLRFDMAEVLKTLPDELRQLAELLQDTTEYAASRVLGRSRRQIANDVARLRELFEDAGLRDYL